ncbi:hypothetical protein MZO42_16550 [Sphingomonas psychrotolerans]|uniref:Lipoprotein n=1 Tax=Sphingomonas psychrotolerans TaxID=1327635 RepID=A0ABU3N7D9_9SPHN|nr:hypothetical protein [Sphingomonas psychrotolerans]MDT8760313.1 hypothetical protein [Sphingomonas psychrotolerans]
MIVRLSAALAAAVLLAGCDMVPEKPPKPAPKHRATPAAAASPAPLTPAERLAAALRAVPKQADDRYRFDGDDKLLDTPFGPVLLRHGHAPDAGHPEGGVVAAYYLREQQGRFELIKAYPEAAMSGSFGDLAKWSVSDKFAALPVLVVEGGGTWQGCTVGNTDLVELRPNGPATLASITTTFDDSGMEQDAPQSLTGKLSDVVRDRSFTVRYEGTRSFAERYVRRGDRFEFEGGESQVPGC